MFLQIRKVLLQESRQADLKDARADLMRADRLTRLVDGASNARLNDKLPDAYRNPPDLYRKVLLHDFGNRSASFRSAEHIRKSFRRSDDFIHGVRVCSVRRNPQRFQGVYRLEAVELLGHQHDIGMKTGDLF